MRPCGSWVVGLQSFWADGGWPDPNRSGFESMAVFSGEGGCSTIAVHERITFDSEAFGGGHDLAMEDIDLVDGDFGSPIGRQLLDGALLVFVGIIGHMAMAALNMLVIGPTTLGFVLDPMN